VKRIAVFDFGGQYAHLIARRIRELRRLSEIVPWEKQTALESLRTSSALILSGGPRSVAEEDVEAAREMMEEAMQRGTPVLGICYGHQLIAAALGGRVERGWRGEFGPTEVEVLAEDPIFDGVGRKFKVWMSHSDSVVSLPEHLRPLARTEGGVIAAFRHASLPIYGLQFHPEVKHTENGMRILENFLSSVASIGEEWFPERRAAEIVGEMKQRMRDGEAVAAVSGGVDSLTAAVLVSMAIGRDKVHALVVDTGLLREGEAEEAEEALREAGIENIYVLDRSETFISRLRGLSDPEDKRRAVAEAFAEVFEEFVSKLISEGRNVKYLVQGTIYPDRIESGAAGRGSEKIKSHHNVVMRKIKGLELVEPLSEFYKDEVREIARSLGIPERIIEKHPFPGPGLSIRVIGEVTEDSLEAVRKANAVVEEELRSSGLYSKVWQAFAVLLPIRTVGVKGDRRAYERAVAVRIVESEDGMTASPSRIPWEVLERISSRIVREVPGVNRVLYDLSTKPPATIEFE